LNFKKLEVYGFKSFADKLTVEFAPGITAIVGPNGCGKSNVADSIRWALGEQSAKSLRGSQMLDVIFNGTEARKSMSYCEVALYFDNTNRIFNCEYDEVVISRKLYRSLESVYCINKQEARLKDITALLHDSGLGRDSYSIIGQGRIDEILSAKAEDRRAIFEDAAGIGKYKQVKLENERRLARINEKLTRVIDITTEQARQLAPLQKQAENAKVAFQLRDQLRTIEVNTFLYQHDTAESRKNAIRVKIDGVNQEYDQRVREFNEANDEYAAVMNELNGIDNRMRDLNNDRLNLNINLERQVSEIKLMQSRISSLREQNKLLQDEIDRCNVLLTESTKKIADLSDSKIQKQNEITKQRKKVDEITSSYMAVSEQLIAYENVVSEARDSLVASIDQHGELKAKLSGLLAEKTMTSMRLAELLAEKQTCENNISDLKSKLAAATDEVNTLRASLQDTDAKLTESSVRYNEAMMTVRELAVKIDKANSALVTLQAQNRVLEDMVNNMQGYAFSVKKLIQNAKIEPQIAKRIEGHIASLIKARPGMELAIETALGGAIQNIVVPAEEDAKFLIEYLRRNKYGRATFLPLTAARPNRLEAQYRGYLQEKGCYGIASDLIDFDEKYRNVFDGLLGKTLVVDTLETAIYLAKRSSFAFKIVTLEGDIINPHGSITGGSTKAEIGNLLSSERELAEMKERVATAKKDLQALTASRDLAAKKQDEAMSAIKTFTDDKHKNEVLLAQRQQTLSQLESEVAAATEQSKQFTDAIQKLGARVTEIDSQTATVDSEQQSIHLARADADSLNAENRKEYDALRAQRDHFHEEMTAAKVELATMETTYDSIEKELVNVKSDCVNYSSTVEANVTKINFNLSQISHSGMENIVIVNSSEQEMKDKLIVIEGELSNLDSHKIELKNRMLKLDEIRRECQERMSVLSDLRAKRESEIEQIDHDLQFYAERITEAYELTYETCLQYKVEGFDDVHAPAEANRLRRELNRLGNINMNAIEDYAELKARYDEEMLGKADLEKSVADVQAVIADMTKEMLSRFTTQFDRIRSNFIQCFRSLFGGGNADLILEEGDPLEAGIGILAEPPGKKLQSISLLSGGERALTAIAILFAILMLKPMPFCVLDEIEAALDDANVERFAKYLHNFSKQTQFIVITHRKPTMELADSLYGVTMEEKGVSKIVSVKLSEAVKSAVSADV